MNLVPGRKSRNSWVLYLRLTDGVEVGIRKFSR